MSSPLNTSNTAPACRIDHKDVGQIVLVLQGGGALGAYQGGVYQALHEAGMEPDWVIGTSIGAINAGIIAGNKPADRLERLKEFWSIIQNDSIPPFTTFIPGWGQAFANALTVTTGVKGFFKPNLQAMFGFGGGLTPETAGYYTTMPLEETLSHVIDMDILNSRAVRMTVGAANVRTGDMTYFDSNMQPLSIKHIMASGALPPAFPAVNIDGELYWDGGIISNTPVEAVFDDQPRRNGLVFAVHMWRPNGPDPDTLNSVMSRQKDLQYASRSSAHITRQKQIHKLRHVVSELVRQLPEDIRNSDTAQKLACYGCDTRIHVVRLVSPPLDGENHTKDIDFTKEGIRYRWEAGYNDTAHIISQHPWTVETDPLEGFILHETESGHVLSHS